MSKPYFWCSFPANSEDQKNVIDAVNQGIDSRLEGFTRSAFKFDDTGRLYCDISDSTELQILLRRLLESNLYTAENLADSIVQCQYGIEII